MASSNETPSNPPVRSLNHQVVLDEDEYTAALSQIIARDFFPSLVQLDATNGYLDALGTGDPHLINASVRRLEEFNTPYVDSRQTLLQTPLAQGPSDTPLRRTPPGEGSNKRPRFDTGLRLDAFQARYTSEDNSSFTQILDDENKKRQERSGWAWDAQRRVEAQRDRMIEQRERMLLEPPPATGVREKLSIEQPAPPMMITDGRESEQKNTDTDKGKEVVAKGKERASSEEVEDVMAPKKDTRSAGVDGWNFRARNSLMFAPDADVSPYQPPKPREGKPDPKFIKYMNTRLPEQDDSVSLPSPSVPPSPTRSRIGAAIAGTPYRPSQTSQKHSLVPDVPSPTPSELGPEAVQQLMTWGTLNATPRVISQEEDIPLPNAPFHIPAPSSREVLGHKLSSTASKNLRAKAHLLGLKTPGIVSTPSLTPGGRRSGMGPPSWTPRRADAVGNLTPAAKRLLERSTLGTAGSQRAAVMERASAWDGSNQRRDALSRTRWTPTPHSQSRR